MATQTAQHQWKQMIVTPVIMVREESGKPIAVPDPDGYEEVRYGCFTCNMGLEEGFDLACPGFDLFDPSNLT